MRAVAAVAEDPTAPGPYATGYTEYKLTATVDPKVTKTVQVKTELWAGLWYPDSGKITSAPLVVFMHGEHGTCGKTYPGDKFRTDDHADYSTTGICPPGYMITPNHTGYGYIAQRLATQGYVVISINANRGINQLPEDSSDPDPSLIIRRARMILRHIEQLGRWNAGLDPTTVPAVFPKIKGKIDFSRISLVGHSRGGDSIVNAYYQFKDNVDGWRTARLPSGSKFVAIAAIAPTDEAVQKAASTDPLPLAGVGYGVLLPLCDGDVHRLDGIRHYDRGVGYFPDLKGNFKASFAVNGADHNGFNTEWQTQDLYNLNAHKPGTQDCPGQKKLFPATGTSADQQEIGRQFVMSVIRAKTKDGSQGELLNPAYDLPKPIDSIAKVDRGYFPGTPIGANLLLQRFNDDGTQAAFCPAKASPLSGVDYACINVPEHYLNPNNPNDRTNVWVALLRWGAPSNKDKPYKGSYFTYINLRTPEGSKDISKLKALDIRMAPDCDLKDTSKDYLCAGRSLQGAKEKGSQNIAIQLVDAKGRYSNKHYVDVKDYTDERQAVGINAGSALFYHAILSTVRIPIADFNKDADKGFDLSKIDYILLLLSPDGTNEDNASGGLFIGDIWATQDAPSAMNFDAPEQQAMAANDVAPRPPLPQFPGKVTRPATSPETAPATLAPDLSGPATPGAHLVDAVRKPSTVELNFATSAPMIAASSGFTVVIDGAAFDAALTGVEIKPNRTRLSLPAAAIDAAGDGATIAVTSGGTTWRFGTLSKAMIR